jgi:hypothetical protein
MIGLQERMSVCVIIAIVRSFLEALAVYRSIWLANEHLFLYPERYTLNHTGWWVERENAIP